MNPVRLVFPAKMSIGTWLLGHASVARPMAAALLLAAFGTACAIAWECWKTTQETSKAHNATIALRSQRSQSAPRSAAGRDEFALTLQQSRDWNQVTRQLNTPWPAILDALESTTPDAVALVAIEPDPQHGTVRLQVEAKVLDTLFDYVASLKSAEPFEDVILLKHETNEQDTTRPVRLSLEARMKQRKPHTAGSARSVR